MVSKVRRIGLTPDPPGGWPLDRLLVGVATLRTLRELFRQDRPQRPWDLAMRTGVTPQGTANALERLRELGIVDAYDPREPGEAVRYRLAESHFLIEPLGRLFHAEREEIRKAARAARLTARGLDPSECP
jgi:DNA-binding transcriptional ArsR family regulator